MPVASALAPRIALLLLASCCALAGAASSPPPPPSAKPAKAKRVPRTFADADEATAALFAAVGKGDLNGVKDALAGGARIDENTIDDKGPSQKKQTPLMFASLIGETRVAKLLLDRGADPTIGEADGYTPLHGCAFQGRSETCRMLLANPRVPNVAHRDGFHPIHRACWGKTQTFADTVEVFLSFGVSPTLRASSKAGGETALQIAKKVGNKATIAALENAAAAQAKLDEEEARAGGEGGDEALEL